MSEKSLSEELKAVLSACTFADLARAVESSSRRWQTNPSYARAAEAFEGLPKSIRKRVANLKVFDSADLIIRMPNRTHGLLSRLSVCGSANPSAEAHAHSRGRTSSNSSGSTGTNPERL